MRLPQPVVDHLRTHHGVVNTRVCLAAGMTGDQIRSRVIGGQWERLHHGVYRVADGPLTPHAVLTAACLAAGPGAVASHRSAAWLWGLQTSAPSPPSVSLGPGRDSRLRTLWIHHSRDLDPRRVKLRHGIACTDPLRTVVDLAAWASPG